MAMEIFKLIGSVMVDSDQAEKSLQKTDDKASNVGKTLAKGVGTAAKWGAAMVTGTVAVAGAAVKLASDAASTADTIDKASQRMNISAESYQELSHAASLCGVEMTTMEKAAKKLEGTDLSMDDALNQIYALETAEERSAKAAELFGDAVAYQMSPMLNASAEDMAAMRQEANDLGLVMSNDTVKSGAELNDAISKVKDSISALATNLGASLMPIIQKVCDMIIGFMPQIQSLVSSLTPVLTSLLEAILPILAQLISSILPLLVSMVNSILPLLVNLIQTVLPPILNLISMLVPPLLQIIGAILPVVISLLETLLPPIIQIVEALLPVLLEVIMALLPVLEPLMQLLQPILDLTMALITPLLQLISAILPPVAKLIAALATVISGALKKALTAIKPLFDTLGKAIAWVGAQVQPVINSMSEKFTTLKNNLTTTFNAIKTVTTTVWNGIKTAITSPIESAKNTISTIVSNIKDTVKKIFDGVKPKLNLSLPKITLKGGEAPWGIAGKGKLPSFKVDWFAKAMETPYMFTKATVVGDKGFGEAGDEIVYGRNNLLKDISEASDNSDVVSKLDELLSAINDLKSMGVVLDSGALVGGIAKPMDKALGQMAVQKARYV